MKKIITTLTFVTSMAGLSQAAISLANEYHLGEAGSVSGANLLPQDSIGTEHFTNLNSNPTVTNITAGLAAPGSTNALEMSNNANGAGTYYGTSLGLTNDWALEVWLRPGTSGAYLGSTDGSSNGTGLRFWATVGSHAGTSLGGNALTAGSHLVMSNGSGFLGNTTSTYTIGTWARVNLITHNSTVYYYLDGVLQDSAVTSANLNGIRLGAGYIAQGGSNGAFDEMKIWTFDSNVDSLASVEAATVAVPEPASSALLGLGGLALILRRRK